MKNKTLLALSLSILVFIVLMGDTFYLRMQSKADAGENLGARYSKETDGIKIPEQEQAKYTDVVGRVRAILLTKYPRWNDAITVDFSNKDASALKGSWWAKDKWDWLAYKDTREQWVILVSFDGYTCTEVDQIPPHYTSYFKNNLYPFETKYCHTP